MKKLIAAILVPILMLLLCATCFAAEDQELSFDSAQEVVDYYDVYIRRYCADHEGWDFVTSMCDLEEGGRSVAFFLCKDDFFSRIKEYGINDPEVSSVIELIDLWTSELYSVLKPFGCVVGIGLKKAVDEDTIVYLCINGKEYVQPYVEVSPNYSYSELVEAAQPPAGGKAEDAVHFYETYLEEYCAEHEDWIYHGAIVTEGRNCVAIYKIAREGFKEKINSKGLNDPFVQETICICNDFSRMICEGLFQYRVYISSVFLTDVDNINTGYYISRDGKESDLFSKDVYTSLAERYGSGGSGSGSTGSSSGFTNKYGTPTTKCAHPGCSNYIASSGDTNCCTAHSGKCLNCGKYIDEDAMYCMDCLSKSVTAASGSSKKSGSGNNGNQKRNGYDMPKEGESFSDYVKRVAPDTYNDMMNQYETAKKNGW